MTETEAKLSAAFRLRRAICVISEKRPSQERAIIDQFLKFIAPSMAQGYGVDFPHTCRKHPVQTEHCKAFGGKSLLLYYHLGNAILGFYDYLKLTQRFGSDTTEALATIERRIGVLEAVAKYGLDQFYVSGSDSAGYSLAPLPPLKIEGFNELPATAPV